MRIFGRTLMVGIIAVLSATLAVSPARAIVGGTADGNTHPNVGIVYVNDQYHAWCSGSLLSPREFLTAGHCTAAFTAEGLSPSQVSVSFDTEVSLSPYLVITTAHPVAVTGWHTHPAFKASAGGSLAAPVIANDVGVIHLAQDINLTPIDLPEAGFLDTEMTAGALRDRLFTLVGYGLNDQNRPLVAIFAGSIGATYTWNQRREAVDTPFMALTLEHLQTAGGALGGDSGGAVFYGGADPNLVVGLPTAADEFGRAYLANQRLDTPAVLDFLAAYR